MEEELQRLKAEAMARLEEISQAAELEEFRIKYLGRKGAFSGLMKQLGKVDPADRPRMGQLANSVKQEMEEAYAGRQEVLSGSGASVEANEDLSLPGRTVGLGRLHPVTQIMEEVCGVFEGLGFAVAEGPDVETDFYNFEAFMFLSSNIIQNSVRVSFS